MAEASLPHSLETVSGKFVDLLNPDPADICIEDIAWSLSRLARYNGHTIQALPYTVGQHSIVVSQEIKSFPTSDRLALLGLLHDAPEYLTGDISGPLKKIPEFRQIVKKLEKTIEEAIYKALKIEPPTEAEEILVKKADNVAQRVEAYNFMMSRGQNWTNPIPISLIKLQEFEPPQPSTEVYLRFLTRYETLTRSLDRKNNEI